MEKQTINNVWNEVRVTSEGISISLISEARGGGAIVEDEMWFTFDEMEAMSPSEPLTLNLSEETAEALSEMGQDAEIARIVQAGVELEEDENSIVSVQEGDVVEDEDRANVSVQEELVVVEVLEDVRCEEYVIQSVTDKTVADENPSYDEDEPVLLAVYESDMSSDESYDDDDVYAFPASRLSRKA